MPAYHPSSNLCVAALLGAGIMLASGCAHLSSSEALPASSAAKEVGIGYGEVPQKMLTGAVSVLAEEDLRDRPVVQVEELLAGRVAGVQVLRTSSGGFKVHIRGIASIYGSNEPLYVVDGMPVYATPGRGLDWLNPGDVVRIEVLKDAGAAAIYGARGGNGVVLITTRRGR